MKNSQLKPAHDFKHVITALTVGLLLSLFVPPVQSESTSILSRLSVIALAPLDGQAVVKLPGGAMRIVRQSEPIPEIRATVVQVLPDRLLVSQRSATAGEELAWIYRAPAQGGFSRVMYMRPHAPRPESERAATP